MNNTSALERNLQLIPWHQLAASANPWISIFVLFTRSEFGLDGALALAGTYYLVVVIFEVPSGWLSDRFGRVPTLRLVAASWTIAFTCFLVGSGSYGIVLAGQVFMALGYASLSGTDVTFHYDTLEALDRHDEYPDRQGWVASRGLAVGAAGALLGGVLGLVDLRLAFAASLLLALVQLSLAWMFTEPPRRSEQSSSNRSQIIDCLRYLRSAPVAWIFGYGVAMVVLEHVAFELLQPWLTEALGRTADDVGSTPLVSGSIIAATALVGSFFARHSAQLARRFGVRSFLVWLGALSALIVTAMALSTSLLVIMFIAFRSAQGSAAPILISTAVSQAVAPEHRATVLSLDSLGGRLAHGGLLVILADQTSGSVESALGALALVAWILVGLVAVSAIVVTARHGADRSV